MTTGTTGVAGVGHGGSTGGTGVGHGSGRLGGAE